jgi:PPK2 family polyphosphate:nucleotide phosphotransferase
MTQPLRIEPGAQVHLADFDPAFTGDYTSKKEGKKVTKRNIKKLRKLQDVLWAQGKHAVLIILQGIDSGGKDGTIEHVMAGINPQGCQVTGFKVPTAEELGHDYLWRIHKVTPRRGYIGIFNRSQYEDVLVVRVHNLVPPEVWGQRYDQINAFEKHLADCGTTILKFFLYISKEEQKRRFEDRLKDPAKNWKFSMGDVEERALWSEYMAAYEAALTRCSTPWAPWYLVPANHKWYRDLVVSQAIVETLERLDLQYPAPLENADQVVIPD